jgi:glycosyltransferase involved in cell wall biosynthesis
LKKRICFIITDIDAGGAQIYFMNLLKKINKEKYDVFVIIPPKGKFLNEIKELTDNIIYINFIKNRLSIVKELRQELNKINPDFIYAHLIKGLLYSSLANLFSSFRLYCNLHAVYNIATVESRLKVLIFRLITFLAQKKSNYIAVSEYHKNSLISYGVNSSKIKVIYNGVEKKEYFNSKVNFPVNSFNVLFVGRLHNEKNPMMVLRIAKQMQGTNIHFTIVGDGPQKDILVKYKEDERLNNLSILGYKENIRELLYESDILLAPSKMETFGIAIAEAMSCNLPIIASNVGGIPEVLIDKKGGFLCKPNDVDGFIEKIQYLKDNPDLMKEFGTFNRQRFEALFTVEKMMEQLEALYSL